MLASAKFCSPQFWQQKIEFSLDIDPILLPGKRDDVNRASEASTSALLH
jgi:hypothetical protein